jgi:hypothetical protein
MCSELEFFYQVTFLKFSLNALDATWLAGHAALEVTLSRGLVLEMNDLAGKYHRKVTSLRVPQICLKVLITTPSGRHTWLEAAQFASDANLDIYSAPAGWRESGRLQADFVRTQDVLTGRAKFLFDASLLKHRDGTSALCILPFSFQYTTGVSSWPAQEWPTSTSTSTIQIGDNSKIRHQAEALQ